MTALLTSLQQDGSVMQDVRDLLDRYLKQDRTVILAVKTHPKPSPQNPNPKP